MIPGRRVFRAANDFYVSNGLVMLPVSIDERPDQLGRHTASFELVFRALKPGDLELKRPNIEKPDSVKCVEMR